MSRRKPELIVALDVNSNKQALPLIEELREQVDWFKVGSRLFTREGPEACRIIKSTGANLFLDLKFHDIPNTVYGAVRSSIELGADMLTLHSSGGEAMMKKAVEALADAGREDIKLLGVTVLTHFELEEFSKLFSSASNRDQMVLKLADVARKNGLDGVVASGWELKQIKETFGSDFLVATPGIRLSPMGEGDDQKRVVAPAEAVRNGADYMVAGRPIIGAEEPASACRIFIDEMSKGRRN